jgi:hypothetical protein
MSLLTTLGIALSVASAGALVMFTTLRRRQPARVLLRTKTRTRR